MSALTYHLTEDSDGAWIIVFEPESLHLYIEFVRPGRTTNPARRMTIDDFLARRPRIPLTGVRSTVWLRCSAERWAAKARLAWITFKILGGAQINLADAELARRGSAISDRPTDHRLGLAAGLTLRLRDSREVTFKDPEPELIVGFPTLTASV